MASVFVIDDPKVATMLEEVLTHAGHMVVAAHNDYEGTLGPQWRGRNAGSQEQRYLLVVS